jgi:DNA-binding Lrp family transcriptional regulator
MTIRRSTVSEERKQIMLELNRDARLSYTELAARTGLTVAIVRYQVEKMVQEGLIKRFTAILGKVPASVNFIVFAYFKMQHDHEKRSAKGRVILMAENKFSLTNTWAVISATSGTADLLRMGSFESVKDAYSKLTEIDAVYGGPKFVRNQSAIVIDVIVGAWPSRNIDMEKVYDKTSWQEK